MSNEEGARSRDLADEGQLLYRQSDIVSGESASNVELKSLAFARSLVSSTKEISTFMSCLWRGFAVWDQVTPCRRDDREEPIRVYKDSELEGGKCVPICQWQPEYSKPRYYIRAPLTTLMDVNVRIGDDHFKFKFRFTGLPRKKTRKEVLQSEFQFAATPPFRKVRVIGQGGFGQVWTCQRSSTPGEQSPGLPQEFALKEVLSKDVFNLNNECNLSRFLPVEEPVLQLGMRHPNLVQAYWADIVAMECSTGEDEAMVAPSAARYTPSLRQGANRSDDQQINVAGGEQSALPALSIASGRVHAAQHTQHAPSAADRTFSAIQGANSLDNQRNNGAGREVSLMPALSIASERVHAAEHTQHVDGPSQVSVQCMHTEGPVVPTCMSGRSHTAQRTPPLSTANGQTESCQHEEPFCVEYAMFVRDSETLSAQLSAQRCWWPGLKTLACQASSKSDTGPVRSLCPSGSGIAATAQEREVEGGGGARLLMRIAMEYCKHGSLATHLSMTAACGRSLSEHLSKDKCRRDIVALRCVLLTALDITKAVMFMHCSNFIHGDLKPQNILIADDPEDERGFCAKVTDFGLAVQLSAYQESVNKVRGTDAYLPMQVFQDKQTSKATDVYALGLVLWEIYHGLLWADIWHVEKARRGASTPWEMNFYRPRCARTCPEEFTSIGHGCLHSDPCARPSAIQVFDRLSCVIQRTAPAVPTSPPTTPRPHLSAPPKPSPSPLATTAASALPPRDPDHTAPPVGPLTGPLDSEAHPSIECPAHERAECFGSGRGHDAQQAQHDDCDMADLTESLTSDSLTSDSSESDILMDKSMKIAEDLERLVDLCELHDKRPVEGEIWSTWYHVDGEAEHAHRLEGDLSPRFPSGESHGEGDHPVEGP